LYASPPPVAVESIAQLGDLSPVRPVPRPENYRRFPEALDVPRALPCLIHGGRPPSDCCEYISPHWCFNFAALAGVFTLGAAREVVPVASSLESSFPAI